MKHVYFLKPVGADGPIKIGCSELPMQRLRMVEIWSPVLLEMIGYVPGGHDAERVIHYMFGNLRLHGEWFTATPELTRFVAETVALGRIPPSVVIPTNRWEWAAAKAEAKGRRQNRDLGGTFSKEAMYADCKRVQAKRAARAPTPETERRAG